MEEEIDWLISNVSVSDLQIEYSWMKEGKKKKTLDGEVHFCDPEVLKKVLICKVIIILCSVDLVYLLTRWRRVVNYSFSTLRSPLSIKCPPRKCEELEHEQTHSKR